MRQYADRPPFKLSASLRRALEFYLALQKADLRREVRIWGSPAKPLVIATDGRVDDAAPPSIAYVLVDMESGRKAAASAVLDKALCAEWGAEEGIALVEEAAVMLALQEEGSRWRHRDIVWYIDNSVILSAMTKGASRSIAIDRAALVLHLVIAGLGARVWWEYVESKANWSDELSRQLKDPWLESQGFLVSHCTLNAWPWTVDASHVLELTRSVVPALG